MDDAHAEPLGPLRDLRPYSPPADEPERRAGQVAAAQPRPGPGAAGWRASSRLEYLRKRPRIQDVRGGRPAAARGCHRESHVVEPPHRMRVGRADDGNAGLDRQPYLLVAEVEPVWKAVRLE